MFERTHVRRVVFILDLVFPVDALFVHDVPSMKYLVEAIPAGVDLQRIREHDKDGYGELAYGDEQRGGRIHGNDVGADLNWNQSRNCCGSHRETCLRAEREVPEDRNDLIYHDGGSDGAANDNVHPNLRVGRDLIEDGEQLENMR